MRFQHFAASRLGIPEVECASNASDELTSIDQRYEIITRDLWIWILARSQSHLAVKSP
jgi:hypothetical protein